MEKHVRRPGWSARSILRLTRSSFGRLLRACWRSTRSRRALLLTFTCLIYLCSDLWITRIDPEPNLSKGGRRWILERIPVSPSPTRSNVVYITLKSKRHKPAVLRGTLRPKSRRKKARDTENPRRDATDQDDGEETPRDPWIRALRSFKPDVFDRGIDDDRSSVRIYSQKSPPWFSRADIETMRFLSRCEIGRVKVLEAENAPPALVFNTSRGFHQSPGGAGEADGRRGLIKRPEDMSEVFAFHLDRVLGLNRSLVTISRRFQALDGQLCPVTLYDPSVVPVPESGVLSWSRYQEALQYRCWQRGVPKPEQICTLHHHEWSKVTLFDFLLQNHQRLDASCCGFRPRPQDSCVRLGSHGQCKNNPDRLQLSHIVHRRSDPRRLVYVNNHAFFDRDEENLDFRLLQGIKELPDMAVSVLRSQRLRQTLLQSLFVDERFWENQGGRRGIDKLIDVIERRARVLLRYINAHGVRLIAMET